MIRTRFAPSPTGYLHVGGARTALFSWAYARKHGGKFVLRIEDTDLERSTEASVNAIIDGMKWLGLDWDEGPYRQMQRLARYREVAEQLLRADKAYWCYASKEELEQMREQQRARGAKPRYDGRWRPENSKAAGLKPPAGVAPVLRFRNPDEGAVTFIDLVKGPITVANGELDDLVILRADGVPTYNFGVVVDDLDMGITHVIRGDDHVNNTPRQVNIFQALGAPLPQFAHAPMILGADGERLSKRHGAVSVMQYPQDGYLPEALFNYLARLGWSHGDAEKFTREQFVEWFDLAHVSKSTAQFDMAKLAWLNHEYIKEADPGAPGRTGGAAHSARRRQARRRPGAGGSGEIGQGSRRHAGTHGRGGDDVLQADRTEQGTHRRASHAGGHARPARAGGQPGAGRMAAAEAERGGEGGSRKIRPQNAEDRDAAAGDAAWADPNSVDRRGAGTAWARHRAFAAATLSCGKLIRLYTGRRKPV